MQNINSPDTMTPVPTSSEDNQTARNMSESKSLDIEKRVQELGKTDRRPSIVEIVADPADELDPRNWKPWKKRLVFIALMSSSILCDGYVLIPVH